MKLTLLIALAAVALRLEAQDWPQFLGPNRNGSTSGTNFAAQWPKEGPPLVWERKAGQGFAGPVVSGGKLILFHRIENKEVVECLDAKSGNELWKADYPTSYVDQMGHDPGPRATPSVANGRVYTFGAEGMMSCWSLADGRKLWGVATKSEFGSRLGFFGLACSPLVEGNAVIVNVGGRNGAGIVAFDKGNGKVLWKTSDDEASYASPVAATIAGRRYALFLTRAHLLAAEPSNGKVLFQIPFRPAINSSVSAATPLVIGDTVFLSASYGAGAALLQIDGNEFH